VTLGALTFVVDRGHSCPAGALSQILLQCELDISDVSPSDPPFIRL